MNLADFLRQSPMAQQRQANDSSFNRDADLAKMSQSYGSVQAPFIDRLSTGQVPMYTGNPNDVLADSLILGDEFNRQRDAKQAELVMNLMPQAGIFAGIGSKTANKLALQKAQDLAGQGVDRKQIWDETGWYNDVDGKWKYEIDDSESISNMIKKGRSGVPLDKAISHDELYQAYPELTETRLGLGRSGTGGSFLPNSLNLNEPRGAPDRIKIGQFSNPTQIPDFMRNVALHKELDAIKAEVAKLNNVSKDVSFTSQEGKKYHNDHALLSNQFKDAVKAYKDYDKGFKEFAPDKSLSLHEIQHNIQDVEPFAQGGWPTSKSKAAIERYKRLAGEAEARNVQTRMDFTPQQRQAQPPWETLDVPENELLVRMLTGQ